MFIDYDDKTIPVGGMAEGFRKYVIRTVGQCSLGRFLWQGLIFSLFSNFPTVIGSVLRPYVYRTLFGGVGSSCFIEKNVRFYVPRRVFLGSRVFIGEGSFIDAGALDNEIRIHDDVHISQGVFLRAETGNIVIHEMTNIGTRSIIYGPGGVEIGRNCLVGNQVELMSGDHIFEDTSMPIRFQGGIGRKITIDEDVWLGAYVIVLPGVTIGRGSVVGAGSVVTKDIPSYSVAAGVPAKVIRQRKRVKSE